MCKVDVLELVKKARAGDREARNQVVEENVGLVWNIVKRFNGRGYEAEDLFQIGCIGLIKAIDHFDLRFDVKFSTYAVPMIMGEIKRFLRDDGMIKVSRSIKENSWRVKRTVQKLNQELGRAATLDEIAAAMELEPEEIVLAMEAGNEVESIYRPMYQPEGKEVYLIEQVVHGANSSVGRFSRSGQSSAGEGQNDAEKEKIVNKVLLEQLLKKLEAKERHLIEMRYYQEKTQTEVAREMGISQVQVSRLEKKILKRLRNFAFV